MIILDSNIWIAFLNVDDVNHKKAEKIFEETKEKIILTEYILLETVTVLSQKVDKEVSDRFIDGVVNNRDIEILPSSEEFLNGVIKFYLPKKNKNLSFVDYSLLYLSKKIKVITFDKTLQREIIDN